MKKETKIAAVLKLPIYSRELASVIFFFFNYRAKSRMLNAQKHFQQSSPFMVNV